MASSYASTVIGAPADEVWARIRDFNGLATWHSGLVAQSEIEDGKAGDQVGGVRSFTLTDGTHIREQLLAHSDLERSYTYNFEKTPFDVDNYCATIRVTPVTDGGGSFVEWWTTSTATATSRRTGRTSSPPRSSRAASTRSRSTIPSANARIRRSGSGRADPSGPAGAGLEGRSLKVPASPAHGGADAEGMSDLR